MSTVRRFTDPAGARPQAEDPLQARERVAVLLAFYGPLLTARQQQLLRLYVEEDLSLAEIAVDGGVSRQAVHDLVRRSVRTLASLERRLGVVARYERQQAAVRRLQELLAGWRGRLQAEDPDGLREAMGLLEHLSEDE